jgi:hypothetical protein
MTVGIVRLDLPYLPAQLEQQLLTYLQQVPLDPDRRRWLNDFHAQAINSVEHVFCPAPAEWNESLSRLYQPYFDRHTISVLFGILKNVGPEPLACLPPHADRGRALAINYYLELGGPQVRTVFYQQQAQTKLQEATNFTYAQAGECVHQQVFEKAWYAYNVDRVHSVEDIVQDRYMIILLLDDPQYHLSDLMHDYPSLTNFSTK